MAVDRKLLTLALCLLLAVNYIDARECKIGCLGKTNPLHNLESGKVYHYAFKGQSATNLAGVKNEVSSMGISAKVAITAGTKCEHFITVTDVKVTSKNEDNSDKVAPIDLKNTVLKFGLQNGKIEDLCADKDERTYALNIKRAILSLLQTSVLKDSGTSSGTENDVHGACPTIFDFTKSGNTLTVKKSKDLNRCAFREKYVGPYSPSSYLVDSDVQSTYFMSGHLTTVQKLEGGVLKEAKTEETYTHNPTSALEAPAKTVIKSSLVLSGAPGAGSPPASTGNIGKTLLYEGGHGSETTTTSQELTNLIDHISKHDNIKETCASSFNKLVRKLHKTDSEEIRKVQSFCGTDQRKKGIFLDALFACGSGHCIYYVGELLSKGDFQGTEAKLWFSKVGFARHVHPDALKKLASLINEDSPTSAFIGVGMLAGRYCKNHPCKLDPSMEEIEKKIASPLLSKGCKVTDKKDEDKVIASMKGLGNINYLTKPIADAVIECATNKANSNRLRAAALDTLRTDAHNSPVKDAVGKVFLNPRADSELRIKAYLVLAECPCGKVATWVKEVLESEKSLQVGAFIVSHLRNVRASTNPNKSALKHHLGSVLTTKKYPFDFRKYSQNYELSYNFDVLNMGTNVESNIIYSQHSFLPRTLSLNLTTQLFGHSFNWLEVDARFENVEKSLEKLFGPFGAIPKLEKDPELFNRRYSEKANHLLETIAFRTEMALRPKRSLDKLSSRLRPFPKSVKVEPSDSDFDIDLDLKTGGSQFGWMKFHGSDPKFDPEHIIKGAFDKFDDVINGAKNIEANYRKYVATGSHEFQYGTSMGLPIIISSSAAAAVTLKVDGKLDIPAIIKYPENTDIKFQLIPSAAIDVIGSITIDGIKMESGIQLHSVAHTSTGSDVSFRILSGTGVDVKFGLPVQKQEVLNFKTSFEKVNNYETSDNLIYDAKREKYEGCFDQLGPYIGLIFCGKADTPWEGPRSLNPAYGPINLKISVDKEDPSLTTYHFRTVYNKDEGHTRKFEALIDTPGTKVNRKVSLNIEGSTAEKKFLKAHLQSPWTEALFDGYVTSTPSESILSAKLKHDETEYLIKGGFKKSRSGNTRKYIPVLEYKAPEFKTTLIGRRGGAKPVQQTYSVTGAILVETNDGDNKVTFSDLSLITPRTKFTLEGSGKYDNVYKNLAGDYILSWDKENIQVKGHYKLEPQKNLDLWLSVLPSQYKDFGIDLQYTFKKEGNIKEKGLYDSKLFLTHGPDPKSTMSRISISNYLENDKSKDKITVENKISYPVLNFEAHQLFKLEKYTFNTGLRGKLDKYSGEIRIQGNPSKEPDTIYEIKALSEIMGKKIEYNADLSRRDFLHLAKVTVTLSPKDEYLAGVAFGYICNSTHFKSEFTIEVGDGNRFGAEYMTSLKLFVDNGAAFNFDIRARKKIDVKLDVSYNRNEILFLTDGRIMLFDTVNGKFLTKLLDKTTGMELLTNLDVAFPKIGKTIRGKGNFKGIKSGELKLSWNPKPNDPYLEDELRVVDSSLRFKYNSDITKTPVSSIVTKSSLDYRGDIIKINLNCKGGILEKGPMVREIEIVLPDGDKLEIGTQGTYEKTGNNVNAKFTTLAKCTHPDGKPGLFDFIESVSLTVGAAPFNIEDDIYKGHIDFTLVNKKKENFDSSIKFDVHENNEIWSIKTEASAKGKLMDNKDIIAKLETEIPEDLEEKNAITLGWSINHGSNTHLEGKSKITQKRASCVVSGKFPEENDIKSFKWATDNTYDIDTDKQMIKLNNDVDWNGKKFVTQNLELNHKGNEVTFVGDWHTAEEQKQLNGKAHWSDGDIQKVDASGTLKWGGDKSASLGIELEKPKGSTDGQIHITGDSKETGKVDFTLKNKIIKEKNGAQLDVSLQIGNNKMQANSLVELVPGHPLVELNIEHPKGTSKILFKFDDKGERHWAGENTIKCSFGTGFNLVSDYDVNMKSLDNMIIKANIDSPDLKMNKIQLDVSNLPKKDNIDQLSFNVKKEGKPYATGNLDYQIKHDGGDVEIEGKGNVKVEDKSYPVSLNYYLHNTLEKRESKLALNVDKRKLTSVYKNTDRINSLNTELCHESECSKLNYENEINQVNNKLVYNVKLTLDPKLYLKKQDPISYQSKLSLDPSLPFEQMVELKWSKTGKLKLHAEVKDKGASLFLHTPKRIFGVESNLESLKDSKKIETSIWFDKNKGDKIGISTSSTFIKGKDSATYNAETKISHKSLGRDYVVKGKFVASPSGNKKIDAEIIVDLFKKPEDKIIINYNTGADMKDDSFAQKTSATIKIDSCKFKAGYERDLLVKWKDLQLSWSESIGYTDSKGSKREIAGKAELTHKNVHGLLKIPGSTVLEIDAKINDGKTFTIIGSTILLNKKYKNNFEMNPYTKSIKYNLNFDGKTLEAEASANMGKKASAKLSLDKKEAAHIDVALDETNFLKSSYDYNTDTIKGLIAATTDTLSSTQKEATSLAKQLVENEKKEIEHAIQCLQNNLPSIKPMIKHVEKQIDTLANDVLKDEHIKALITNMKKPYEDVINKVTEVLQEIKKFLESMERIAVESCDKLTKLWKDISPKLVESADRVGKILLNLAEETVKVSKKIIGKVLDELKKHEKDVKEYLKVVTDLIHEFGKNFGSVIFTLHEELEKIIEITTEQLKDLPFVAAAKEKWNELKELQPGIDFWETFMGLTEDLKAIMPTKESADLVEMSADYLSKLIKSEKFDVQEASVKLLQQLTKAITSLFNELNQLVPIEGKLKPKNYLNRLSFGNLIRAPKGGLRISLLRWLTSKDLPSIYELISTYHPSLNPLDNIPPFQGIGLILEGSEIITFDGRHVGFKGTCEYILVGDFLDVNFTIVASVKSGKLEAIAVNDGPDTIVISPEAEFPKANKFMSGWIRPHSYGVYHESGALVICSRDLTYCEITVSGFYFDRLRGLMGNMNYETYDDLQLPSGEIASDDTSFGNGWKLGTCPDVPSTPHTHNRNPICTELFTKDVQLLIGSPWTPVSPFRAACDHAVEAAPADKQHNVACKIVAAYIRMARAHGALFLTIPTQCVQCTIDDKKLGWDDIENFKIDPKKADVVFVVDGSKDNEEFFNKNFNNLVQEIKKSYEAQQCTDIRFSVVSFSPVSIWPHYHTSKGNFYGSDVKINFKNKPERKNKTITDNLIEIRRIINKDIIGNVGLVRVYDDVVLQNNFRPTARKTIVGIHGSPCDTDSPVNIIKPAIESIVTNLRGINYHLITPVTNLTNRDIPTSDIIGFDDKYIINTKGEKIKTFKTTHDFDMCSTAAIITDGFTFVSDKVGSSLPQVAKIITSNKAEDAEVQCTCALLEGVISRPQCVLDYLEVDL